MYFLYNMQFVTCTVCTQLYNTQHLSEIQGLTAIIIFFLTKKSIHFGIIYILVQILSHLLLSIKISTQRKAN